MDSKLTKIYYSPKGYWKGMAAIKKLANAAKVSEDVAYQTSAVVSLPPRAPLHPSAQV